MDSSLLRVARLAALTFVLCSSAHAQALSLLGLEGAPGAGGAARGAVPPGGRVPGARSFVTGFNQAWIHTDYGVSWTARFDEAEVRRLIAATRAHGGRVLRLWLFEGRELDGVIWDGNPAATAASVRTRPTGISPQKLANIERVLEIAGELDVQIYLTFFDAIVYTGADEPRHKAEWWNLLNDTYGAGTAFLENVMRPILSIVARHRKAVFGIDLLNEFNAMVRHGLFENRWKGANAFISGWRTFIRREVDVPVTASFGHHDAIQAMVCGNLDEGAVDFYDFHVYTASGDIPWESVVSEFAHRCGKPVYLGEFGQSRTCFDDRMQADVTARFLRKSHEIGLAGAFAWRLSDIRPGHNPAAYHSFEAFGAWRPAMAVFREVSIELGAAAR